ncbi:MAG: ferritin-like domain-containing protein [Candidatus Binatia bacterium]
MAKLRIGSEQHKELFCREFIATHAQYDVTALDWPTLDAGDVARLRALPFWEEAVSTEHATAAKVQAQAQRETDPLMREAVALQGYEEARHSTLIHTFLTRYEISVACRTPPPLPTDIEWAFLRTEYGECFDAFFAFGLFAVAKESGFFPSALVTLFEPIMQEEARHILFFVNWVAYRRARTQWWRQPQHLGRCALAVAIQAWSRLQTARGVDTGDFTVKGHEAVKTDLSPRAFLELCLRENDRRLGAYDARLLRPRLVPTLARSLCRLLP